MTLIAIDLDGTLEDSRDDMVASVHRVRRRLGLTVKADADVRPFVNRGMPTLYARCFAELENSAAKEAYEADYAEHIADATTLYPGIAEALEALAGLGTLALVTNKPEHLSRLLLKALAIDTHFSAVIGGDTCEHGKPHPIMLERALESSGASGPVIMVGDSAGDMRLGRSAGAKTVWCGWGYLDDQPEPSPDATAASPGELPGAIAGLLPR